MNGSVLALMSAFWFAVNSVCTRRGVVRVDNAALGGYITVFVTVPLFLVIGIVQGDIQSIGAFSWQGYLWLALAGIIHFVAGRTFLFMSVKHLGAILASIFSTTNIAYTVALGFLFLGEKVTANTIIGSVLIMVGPAVSIWSPTRNISASAKPEAKDKPKITKKGLVAAILSGIFFGSSALFIKWGLRDGGSPLSGAFISYVGAALVLMVTITGNGQKYNLVHMERRALGWFILAGVLGGIAQLLRYQALDVAPISVVGPLVSTTTVFLLVLSAFINRKTELFGPTVITGAILVVAGAALVYR